MGIALVAGLYAAFLAVVIIVWYVDERNKRRAQDTEVVMRDQAIRMKEREIMEKFGPQLPMREYDDEDRPRIKYMGRL